MMELDRSGKGPPPPEPRELEAFGRISAELLHDLAGVLAIISGRASLAHEEAALGRTPSDELARIRDETEELRRMVSDVLEELRGLPRSPEVTFPLRPVVEETVDRWFSSAPSLTTTFRASLDAGREVAGPRSFFGRALWNLLRNAGRHAHGEIRLTLREIAGGSKAELLVEDDGDGVAEAMRGALFEPFAASSEGGTGLGLSFSRWALEKLGGSLEHEGSSSDLGGARFRAVLPLVRPRPAPTLRKRWGPGVAERRPLEGLRLALVDDEPALLSVLARVLRRAGAEVSELGTDEAATADRLADDLFEISPDVILLDLNLGAFGGLDVLEALRSRVPGLHDRVILLTGGSPPRPDPDRPVIHKLTEWPELYRRIREEAERSGGRIPPR